MVRHELYGFAEAWAILRSTCKYAISTATVARPRWVSVEGMPINPFGIASPKPGQLVVIRSASKCFAHSMDQVLSLLPLSGSGSAAYYFASRLPRHRRAVAILRPELHERMGAGAGQAH